MDRKEQSIRAQKENILSVKNLQSLSYIFLIKLIATIASTAANKGSNYNSKPSAKAKPSFIIKYRPQEVSTVWIEH